MPNTLIHIAIQAPASRAVYPRAEIPWILVGAIIPDIPWIFQRIIFSAQLADPYKVQLYFSAQASLFFCLILSLALSTFSKKPLPLFFLLAANSMAHLLLDALQIKWGNGVHLLAPFSWQTVNFGLIWPEHIIGYVATSFGIIYFVLKLKVIFEEDIALNKPLQWKYTTAALCLYCVLPFVFLDRLEKTDTNYILTLQKKRDMGSKLELDRIHYSKENEMITLFTGESLKVTGVLPEKSGTVSLRGKFSNKEIIHSSKYHIHNNYRDHASKAGLLLTLIIWLSLLVLNYYSHRRGKKSTRQPSTKECSV